MTGPSLGAACAKCRLRGNPRASRNSYAVLGAKSGKWGTYEWRLPGRQGLNTGTLTIADFRYARGVYVLHNELAVYVGLASEKGGLGGRLKDHLVDKHGSRFTRFSWFAFHSPGVAALRLRSSVEQLDYVKAIIQVMIRALEALLQMAIQPRKRNRDQLRAGFQMDAGRDHHNRGSPLR